jgi:DNA polymerase-1
VGLRDDVPMEFDLERLRYGGWDKDKLRALFVELEFNKLADSLDTAKAVTAAPQADPVFETVLTEAALDAAIAACRAAGGFAVDTETTSLDTSRAELVGVSLAWKALHGGCTSPSGTASSATPPSSRAPSCSTSSARSSPTPR